MNKHTHSLSNNLSLVGCLAPSKLSRSNSSPVDFVTHIIPNKPCTPMLVGRGSMRRLGTDLTNPRYPKPRGKAFPSLSSPSTRDLCVSGHTVQMSLFVSPPFISVAARMGSKQVSNNTLCKIESF